jgi:vitamin K-dependent gamma-carboxylase
VTSTEDSPAAEAVPLSVRPIVVSLLGVFFAWQVLMPLRHFIYPGDVSWHEQGHKWSWHMKLRRKAPAGATFFVLDKNDRMIGTYDLRPADDELIMMPLVDPAKLGSPLSSRQARTMATRPELILQFAHFLRDKYLDAGLGPVKVTANVQVSLNGRPPQHLIDPEADLAVAEDRIWPPVEWILPLDVAGPELRRFDVSQFAPMFSEGAEDESGE